MGTRRARGGAAIATRQPIDGLQTLGDTHIPRTDRPIRRLLTLVASGISLSLEAVRYGR